MRPGRVQSLFLTTTKICGITLCLRSVFGELPAQLRDVFPSPIGASFVEQVIINFPLLLVHAYVLLHWLSAKIDGAERP